MKVQASARVQVTIEVEASLWGGDCSIDQLYKQAGESAIGAIRNACQKSNQRFTLIGEPKVIGVITEQK